MAGLALIVVAIAGAWQLAAILGRSPFVWHDFTQDWVAVREVMAGNNPYLPQNAQIAALFGKGPPDKEPAYSFHPPTTLVFFMPLAPLGYREAFVAWTLLSLGALWGMCHLLLRASGWGGGPLLAIGIALGLVCIWPLRENFVEGQLNVVVAAFVVGWWYAARANRDVLAGASLAAAVALKPLAGLIVLYVLWRRRWRVFWAAAIVGGAIALVGIGLAGVEGTRDYVTTAYPIHANLWPGYHDNASPQGLITRLFGPTPWRPWPMYNLPMLSTPLTLVTWAIAVAVLFATLGTRASGTSERHGLELAALAAAMPLVTPIIWPHYYILLVPTFWFLGIRYVESRAWGLLALLVVAAAVLWIPRNDFFPRQLGNVHLPGLLLLFGLSLHALRRHPTPIGGAG